MTMNNSINFVDSNTLAHTNTIDSSWGKIKLKINFLEHIDILIKNYTYIY